MTPESLVQVGLMAFVLLAPTLMVAVLVSGLSRRAVDQTTAEAVAPTPAPAQAQAQAQPQAA